MRSAAEIRFRLAQEVANAGMWLLAPSPRVRAPRTLSALPDPASAAGALRGTAYAADVERLAGEILRHRFPLLGTVVETGETISWRRDYTRGIETAAAYFRRVPYLDAARAGDHKFIWELNRHQHLVLLAQAFRLTGEWSYLDEIWRELESWLDANPFLRGINWTSALEVAFRSLSWIWVWHLAGEEMPAALAGRFLTALYRHGLYLERNLSVYFSRNTHLLGEAVALHALGALFPEFPRAARWRSLGDRVVEEEMAFQVREDGSHFEQSDYYHVYAVDMFLFHAILEQCSLEYLDRLRRMCDYLAGLMAPARVIPGLGDDDGGRLFHPYGERARFGRATLAAAAAFFDMGRWPAGPADASEIAAWWLGPDALARAPSPGERPASRLFRDSGVAVMHAGEWQVVADAGPFGPWSAGHSHSDTLALVLRNAREEVLADCGTFTYVGDPAWRDRFRGSAAHNTVRIGGRDQALSAGPFRWLEPPAVRVEQWSSTEALDRLEAVCAYGGFTHRRAVLFAKPDLVVVRDDIDGPAGEHTLEQFWHAGAPVQPLPHNSFAIGACATLAVSPALAAELSKGGEFGWRSAAFGARSPAPVLRAHARAALPLTLWTAIDLSGAARNSTLEVRAENGRVRVLCGGRVREIA